MENQFCVTICRFHTKAENKLLIIGWFSQNGINENKLLVCLDKKKIPFTMEKVDLTRSLLRTREGILITRQYYLWIDLPRSWRDCKRLEVKNFYQGAGKTAYYTDVSKLRKAEKEVQRNIDKSTVVEDGFQILGWYIDQGNVKLRFSDKSGRKYPAEIIRKDREDVRKVFPENAGDEVVGFLAYYKGSVPKQITVSFEGAGRYAEETLTLVQTPVQKGISSAATLYKKAAAYYRQFGISATALRALDKLTGREEIAYRAWLKRHTPSGQVLRMQREHKFEFSPKISIVVPLYKTPEKYLAEMIESVRSQTYGNWELCLSDGSGENSPIEQVLKQYEEKDHRIRVVYNKEPLQISDNTNEALKITTGDYIAFADHDDMLAPDALYECVKVLNQDSDTEIIYTDEDKVDMNGRDNFMPNFKSDFNLDMLRCTNYICHLFVVKRNIYEAAGMLNSEYDGAQDYDFVLRCIERSSRIKHIPKILYHWRAHKDSTAENPESKNYAYAAGRKAIQAHYDRTGIQADAYETEYKGFYRSKYRITEQPLISVIIPNKDHIADLEKCIASLEERNTYKNLELVIVENNSEQEETFAYYKKLEEKNPKVKVVYWEGKEFNYSSINNFGVEQASGEYLLFLNNDTELVNMDCIEELLGYCQRSDVGAVGARMYYEDGTIQHAGVIIGLGGVAGHAFSRASHEDPGYFGRIIIAQNYNAVTAACMLTKKPVFHEVGGFDEKFAVAFNDVDLCLRIRKAGYLIVYNPYAELNHYESKSRGYEDTPEKVKRFNSEIGLFEKRWKNILNNGDPYYNPNLTLEEGNFGLNPHAN